MKPTDIESSSTVNAEKPESGGLVKVIATGVQADKFNLKALHDVKQLVKNREKIEVAAQEVLHTCNAKMDNTHIHEKVLKKGEGRTIGGNG